MNSFSSKARQLLNYFDFNKGDLIFLASDITNLMNSYKKKGINFDINLFIDLILEKIGEEGTLVIPTYNWSFCQGVTFDYRNTPTMTGSIGRIALQRNDFKRTTNPIYSFAVCGKDKELLYNLKHSSCFGDDSPFFYFHKKNAKYFSINVDYKNLGFTPCHYVEEKVGVSYRHFKYFSGNYIDENGLKKKVKYKFYARDLSKDIMTGINPKADKLLIDINAYRKYFVHDEFFGIINLGKALDFLIYDMKNNPEDKRIIYPIRGKKGREKINIMKIYQ